MPRSAAKFGRLTAAETPFRRGAYRLGCATMLTSAQRKWFLLEQIIVPVLFNLGFNAVLGWFTFRTHTPVPLWGQTSVGADILGMLFFLPAFTCVIAAAVWHYGGRRL